MIDERPIKPDKKYLEEYIEKMSHIEKKEYLKKRTSEKLPCYAHGQIIKTELSPKSKDTRSKAEIYEEIKQKNRKRFGEKKKEEVPEEKIKKIDPKKMTVCYKHKQNGVKINIEEYKKQGFVKREADPSKKEASTKVEYDKLLEYFRKQMNAFEEEKAEFEKVANKLKFKDSIRKEEGLSYSKIKSQVQNNLITQNLSIKSHQPRTDSTKECKSDKPSTQKPPKLTTIRQCSKRSQKQSKPFSKTFSIGEIRNCLQQTDRRVKQLKSNLFKEDVQIKEHRYDISQIYLLPEFTPQSLYDYIDPLKLKFSGNVLYKEAIQVFNSKFQKSQNQEEENISEVKQGKNEIQIKVKYVGEKRVMKYEGWTQVWIPGKQRLLTNNQGYKVVWLSNGDVLQEFPNKIKTYFSKTKQILKIDFHNLPSIYYHDDLKQIWRVLNNDSRQIIFSNGRKEIAEEKKESLL